MLLLLLVMGCFPMFAVVVLFVGEEDCCATGETTVLEFLSDASPTADGIDITELALKGQ